MKFRELGRRVSAFLRARQLDRELAEEQRIHQEMAQEDGADPGEALRALGNPLRLREQGRSVWRIDWLDAFFQDLRSALRKVVHEPGFSLTVIGLLALAIGANTAVFSFIDRVLLRELPVREPGQLVQITVPREEGRATLRFTRENYEAFLEKSHLFSDVYASFLIRTRLYRGEEISQLETRFVSGNYLPGLGVLPTIGRVLTPADDEQEAAHVAVISHRCWRERFGANPNVLGQPVRLNNRQYSIVGVVEPKFFGTNPAAAVDLWVSLARAPELREMPEMMDRTRHTNFELLARLHPGVDIPAAEAELTLDYRRMKVAVMEEFSRVIPNFPAGSVERARRSKVVLAPAARGLSDFRDGFRRPLWLLFGGVALVLLIGCSNLAALFLARGAGRSREAAVRMAIGAGRGRVVRQLVIESLALGVAGASAGLWVAASVERWMLSMLPVDIETAIDGRVFGFAFALAIVTALLFGVYPAYETTRLRLAPALKEGLAHGSTGRASWARRLLIAVQVSLSVTLLLGATLFLATLRNVYNVELGFETSQITEGTVSLNIASYEPHEQVAFWSELVAQTRERPGVDDAAVSLTPLVKSRERQGMPTLTIHLDDGAAEALKVNWSVVSDRFFSTAGIQLLQGREFTSADRIPHHWPAVVNREFVRRYLPDRNPLGPHFGLTGGKTRGVEIVGVVADARMGNLTDDPTPFVWLPYWVGRPPSVMTLLVKGRGDLPALMRETVTTIDADIPVMRIETPANRLWDHVRQERLLAAATTVMALIALALASVGLTGLISREVATRTREIGVRRALGARPSALLKLVLAREAVFVLAGVGLGFVLSMVLLQFAKSRFYGVQATDPWVLAVVVITLCTAALLAAWIPARRALSVSAASALRHE